MCLEDQGADLKQFAGSSSPAIGILLAALNGIMPEGRNFSNGGLQTVIRGCSSKLAG
jgi:hypothetical protein